MKKVILFLILGAFLVILSSFAFAESEAMVGQQQEALQNYVAAGQANNDEDTTNPGLGAVVSTRIRAGDYENENGEKIRIEEMENSRIRIHSGNLSADCDCELEEEQIQNRTRLKVKLSNGENSEIKIMPDTASETALKRLRMKVCSEENGCSIELKEVGNRERNESRVAYEVQAERHFKILGMFQTKAQVKAQVDAENGEVLQVKKPWWAFLASEPEETSATIDSS